MSLDDALLPDGYRTLRGPAAHRSTAERARLNAITRLPSELRYGLIRFRQIEFWMQPHTDAELIELAKLGRVVAPEAPWAGCR